MNSGKRPSRAGCRRSGDGDRLKQLEEEQKGADAVGLTETCGQFDALALFAAFFVLPLPALPQTPPNLDAQVAQLFDRRCAECHFEGIREGKKGKQPRLDAQVTCRHCPAAASR